MSIRVNFARPIPIFPLETPALLPQQVLPLHIFEPRYRQMVDRALDGAGQIAMAVFDGERWKTEYAGNPPVKPAVCIGQIVRHERLADGRYNILLQGVCRARIAEEFLPDPEDPSEEEPRLYREAILEPVGIDDGDPDRLESMRRWVEDLLTEGPLRRLTVAEQVLKYVQEDDIPSGALLELVSFALLTDDRTRYSLLSEGNTDKRLDIVRSGLESLSRLIRQAESQHPEEWPKGMSWN